MARLEFHPERLEDVLRTEMAKKLIKCAIVFIGIMQRNLSTSFPPASVPGEFPHWRTGTGRSNVSYAPQDVVTVKQTLSVKVGVRLAGQHIAILEIKFARLGFIQTFNDNLARFEAVLK